MSSVHFTKHFPSIFYPLQTPLMATLSSTSYTRSSWPRSNKTPRLITTFSSLLNTYLSFPLSSLPNSKRLNFSVKAEKENESSPSSSSSSSSITVVSKEYETEDTQNRDLSFEGEELSKENGDGVGEGENVQQEFDWNTDEEFEEFMAIPSIQDKIKLKKKEAESFLEAFDLIKCSDDPVQGFLAEFHIGLWRRRLERLKKSEEVLKPLDYNKLKNCFGYNTFFVTDVVRHEGRVFFIGNLKKPVDEVMPILEKKLSEAAGREVLLWFVEKSYNGIPVQACSLLKKEEVYFLFESDDLCSLLGCVSSVALTVTTFGTIALMSGFFLKPDATFNDYLADVVPLFGGFLTVLGVSEIATRVTAAHYGVKLSPSFLVPSSWTGCLGVMNNYKSFLPNKNALVDIPVARTATAYLTSLILAAAAFVADGSFNGGDNALYIRPQFFYDNPLLSLIQFVIGPHTYDLGNVLPYAVEGVGVPVNPLAFAGLLGMVVTSLNLLPIGRLEGGRIALAMFGRRTAGWLTFATLFLLGIGALRGSVLCLAWAIIAAWFRGGEELIPKDDITPLGDDRFAWGLVLGLMCFLTFFPNGGGTFSNVCLSGPYFRGDL